MSFNKLIKVQILHSKAIFELKIPYDIKILDLKYQIEKHENINLDYYFLFYENVNLLEIYNKYTLREILESKHKENENSDYVFFLISKSDYKNSYDELDILNCETHQYNKAYLYCSTCQSLICDKCKTTLHAFHEYIIDQGMYLEAYFTKISQISHQLKDSILDTRIIEYRNITNEMEFKLQDFIKLEKEKVDMDVEKFISKLNEYKELEKKRLDSYYEAGMKKISDLRNDTEFLIEVYNKFIADLKEKENYYDTFKNFEIEEKITFLKNLQVKNFDIYSKKSLIEKVSRKYSNLKEYDVSNLIKSNDDFAFRLILFRLKDIINIKIQNLHNNLDQDSCLETINKMEQLVECSENSKVFYKSQNLNQVKKFANVILQPIVNSSSVHVFNVEQKNISKKDIYFHQSQDKKDLYFFPTFCRSINVNGKLYVTGGEFDSTLSNNLIEVDCKSFEAKKLKSMDVGRSAHSIVNINDMKLIVISGAYGEVSCEQYFIDKNYWSSLPRVLVDRVGASTLTYCSETIYLFYGKKFDVENKQWKFVEKIEMINLFMPYPKWTEVHFKIQSQEIYKKLAFSGSICCPNNKVLILGGQTIINGNISSSDQILEIDFEEKTISKHSLKTPNSGNFIESNFYFYNFNALNIDSDGVGIMYSLVYDKFGIV